MPKTDLKLTLDSHIWLPTEGAVPEEVIDHLEDALTFETLEWQEAEQYGNPTDGIEQWVQMYEHTDSYMLLPRGFAWDLVEGLGHLGITYQWKDDRCHDALPRIGNEIEAFPYQEKFRDAFLDLHQGIGIAPTGSGKTVAVLDIIQRNPGKSIVVVNTKEIASQWMKRCKTFLGADYPVSMVGDGKFEVSEYLTIALQGTLWSRHKKLLKEGFFELFRNAFLDECHHATADTFKFIMGQFNAEIRGGVSATPKKTGDFRLAENTLGPVIVEITDDEVESKTMKPTVEVIETTFGDGGKKKRRKKMNTWARRMSYEKVISALAEDDTRNRLIADEILTNWDTNANLVLSKRIEHLSNIWEALVEGGYPADDILTIVGMNKLKERNAAIERIEEANCVVLSTLADEALDAPRLDVVHLAWPTKNPDLIIQQVGRVRRRHNEKEACWVIDYRDQQVDTLNNQYMTRRHEVYNPKGWQVTKRKGTQR